MGVASLAPRSRNANTPLVHPRRGPGQFSNGCPHHKSRTRCVSGPIVRKTGRQARGLAPSCTSGHVHDPRGCRSPYGIPDAAQEQLGRLDRARARSSPRGAEWTLLRMPPGAAVRQRRHRHPKLGGAGPLRNAQRAADPHGAGATTVWGTRSGGHLQRTTTDDRERPPAALGAGGSGGGVDRPGR